MKIASETGGTVGGRLAAGVLVLLSAFSVYLLVTRFEVTTDFSLFLPQPESTVERVLMRQLDNGMTSRLIFLTITE